MIRPIAILVVARRAGVTVWIAGPPLMAALRHGAGITRRGARPSAAMLGRLPAIPWLRSLLRRLEPLDDERQIPLLENWRVTAHRGPSSSDPPA